MYFAAQNYIPLSVVVVMMVVMMMMMMMMIISVQVYTFVHRSLFWMTTERRPSKCRNFARYFYD